MVDPARARKDAQNLANNLEGTCEGLQAAMYALDLDEGLLSDPDFTLELDNAIQLCSVCSWWHTPDDGDVVGGEFICIDCENNKE